MSRETYNYKRYAMKAARELCYPETVLAQLRHAQTEVEVERIMVQARKDFFD